MSASTVQWNGSNRTTAFVNASQLTASITTADVATAGAANITVVNPAPGGGTSTAATFTSNNPVPSVSSLSPSSASAGGAGFSLTVTGTNFVSGSTVRWNGSNRTTTYVSATQLNASITAADIVAAGTANVTVANPTPGGGASSAVSFNTSNPIPSVLSLSPSSASAGGAAFTLTVNGTNFVSGSTVQWNGGNRTTTYVSAAKLTASITAADIAIAQNAAIAVVSPAPGGGASPEVGLAVTSPAPSIGSISPSSAAAGSAAFTLTVNGSNFLPGSTVQWNGSYGQPPLATTYVSANQITVTIPASDIAYAGSSNVTVINPGPGGGTSAAAAFTITGSIPSTVSLVAPNGNDANPGTVTQPYLTIQKCATTVSSGSTCAIRAGTYRETVTPVSGITITSYDGEPVTVDGSDPVTGWTVYQGSIYKANAVLATGDTNQVFVGNQMMTEARWPNGDDLFHVNWATMQTGTTGAELSDSNLPNVDWTGAKIHFLSGTDPYNPETGTVTASAAGQLAFNLDDVDNPPNIAPMPGGYYYVYRSLAALDAQREWFYDTAAHVLYFWAPGSADPSTLGVRAKQRQYAFDLSGQSNVKIEHINLFASNINMNSSSSNNTIDSINAQYVSHYTDLPSQSLLQSGASTYGWDDHNWDSGIILNGSGNILQNSTIAWSAGNGVALWGSNNAVKNNLIMNTGYVGNDAMGIDLFGAGHTVQNNTVHTSGRYAVTINSYPANPNNDDVSNNNLFNAMMLGPDGGEVYTGDSVTTSTRIHNNWLHDTQALLPLAENITLAGVYLDEEASGFEVDQNVLWNNEYFNIFLHGSSSGVTTAMNDNVHNNSIPDVDATGYIWLMGVLNCGTTQIIDNLVLEPVSQSGTSPTCSVSNNSSSASGATGMNSSVQVGCNFAGCASSGPPAISGGSVAASIAVQPYDMTVTAGQPVTFSVTGAGSPTISYQWQRNGVDITGATSATYAIPVTAAADNGAIFTVTVSNSDGSATSNPATLTVD